MLLGWYASSGFVLVLLFGSRGLLRGRLYLKDVLVVALLAIFVLAALIIAVLSPARYDFEILRRVPKSRRVKMYSLNISATKKSPIFKMETPDTNEKSQSVEFGFVPPGGAKIVNVRSIPFHFVCFIFMFYLIFIFYISHIICYSPSLFICDGIRFGFVC